ARVLSGAQYEELAKLHLNAINQLSDARPWAVSFSYGRALQDPALEAWGGDAENADAGRRALLRRAWCNSAACAGPHTGEMEPADLSRIQRVGREGAPIRH